MHFCRQKAAKLMNGSSSSRQKDAAAGSSQQRHTGRLALKRRAGAAAKAAQKYADFEVTIRFVLIICQFSDFCTFVNCDLVMKSQFFTKLLTNEWSSWCSPVTVLCLITNYKCNF